MGQVTLTMTISGWFAVPRLKLVIVYLCTKSDDS